MFERKTIAEEHIIDQGDDGDNFYIIDRGIFDIYVKIDGADKKVCRRFISILVLDFFFSVFEIIWLNSLRICISEIVKWKANPTIHIVFINPFCKKVGAYNNKGSFGELALMYNTPRYLIFGL